MWKGEKEKNRGDAEGAEGTSGARDGIRHEVVNDAENDAEGIVDGEYVFGGGVVIGKLVMSIVLYMYSASIKYYRWVGGRGTGEGRDGGRW